MTSGAIWVTRPAPRNATTSAALQNAGFQVIGVPVLVVRHVAPAGGLPLLPPDWVLFVSPNAVRGLEAAGVPAGVRSKARAAAVGSHTAFEAAGHGWKVELVPKNENAEGLLKIMRHVGLDRRRVWIPGGSREGSARRTLPQELRARGADVITFCVYETLDRMLEPAEMERLRAADPGFIVFHSPSAVEAVFHGLTLGTLLRWQDANLVAIGPATLTACLEVRTDRVWESPKPSDASLIGLITSIANRMTEERSG